MKERQTNIELLRIFCMLGIIILHYNNRTIGGAFSYTEDIFVNKTILMILESLFSCSVDIFIIISGYFMFMVEQRRISKVIELFVQVIVFSVVFYLIGTFNGNFFSIGKLIKAAVPNNYFVTLYCVVFLISPALNLLLRILDSKSKKKFIYLNVILFAFMPWILDIFIGIFGYNGSGLSTIGTAGSQFGYTVVNFVLMYLIGAFIKSNEQKIRVSMGKLLVLLVLLIAVITVLAYWNEDIAWSYCSPIVIGEAVAVFLIFKKISLKNRKWVNILAESAFTCFLAHTIFLRRIHISEFCIKNPFIMILHIVFASVLIYIVCWFLHGIYYFLSQPIRSIFRKHESIFELKQK